MQIIAGLGNPGGSYSGHRHNIGFRFADQLADRFGFGAWRSKFHAAVAEGRLGQKKVLLIKPQTFMNRSGISVAEALNFYKIHPSEVLIVHDELDLPLGQFKMKSGGGDGGHNGLKSISQSIGREYRRLRLGIDRPPGAGVVNPWVLGNFSASELALVEPLLDDLVDEGELLTSPDPAAFANRVHVVRQKRQ